MLPLQGTQIQSLVGELRSCKLHSVSKKKKERERVKYLQISLTEEMKELCTED